MKINPCAIGLFKEETTMSKKMVLSVALMVLALVVNGCGQKEHAAPTSEAKTVFKLATMTPMDHMYNQGAARFAQLVKERSQGRIEIAIHPDGQLAKGERELLEAIRQGSLDFYVGSTGPVAGFSPSMGILDLPFLFRDYAHADKVLDGSVGRGLLDDLDKAGLKGLAFWENGFRNLTNSKRAVKSPADAKGLRIRTMENEIHLAAWKAIGAEPVPMAYGELYAALQKKTIDGEENPIAIIDSARFNEVQKYLSLTQHVYSPALIVVSPKVWQGLSRADQEMLLATAQEVASYQRQLGRTSEEKQINELEAKGMKVTRKIDKAAWAKAMEPAMGKFIDAFGKDKIKMIIDTK
jgi:TRAP-type transport system periplasmic protein